MGWEAQSENKLGTAGENKVQKGQVRTGWERR
ncbi:MAG: hypothetical protein V7638_285 [Acidobacteriota bacterium]